MNKYLKVKEDDRGVIAQIFDMGKSGEVLYGSVKPGKKRGNHYHKKKNEMFFVLEGNAKFKMRNIKTDEREEYDLSGDKFQILEVLPFWTHSIENMGNTVVKFFEYGDSPYDEVSPDSFYEVV
jgi:UDP-2-acetamido-2,6-beta-L-arabino-hexul-4-ose reductase